MDYYPDGTPALNPYFRWRSGFGAGVTHISQRQGADGGTPDRALCGVSLYMGATDTRRHSLAPEEICKRCVNYYEDVYSSATPVTDKVVAKDLALQIVAERKKRAGMQKRLDTLQSIVELHLPRIDGNAEEAQRLAHLVDRAMARHVQVWAAECRKLRDRIAGLEATVEVLATGDIAEPPASGDPAKYGTKADWLKNARLPDWIIEKMEEGKKHDDARRGVNEVSKGQMFTQEMVDKAKVHPDQMELPFDEHTVRGVISDAGGGEMVVRVDRDTMNYMKPGSIVEVRYWKKP